MARKRVIDPSFFTDGELWEALADWGLLFYIGLWTEAEDSGCFESHPSTLKNRILPGRPDVKPADVAKALKVLVDLGKIEPYEVATPNGKAKKFYWLVNFGKHQRIDYPTPPKIPLPDWMNWHGEAEFAEGEKGTKDYKPNRRKWHYEVV